MPSSSDGARRERVARSIEVQPNPSGNGGFMLSITDVAMLELMPVFEAEGSYSNGPAWEAIIEYLISVDRLSGLELDSEASAALAFAEKRDPLDHLRSLLLDAAADEQKLRQLIREGRAAGFGHGDL